MNIRWNPSERRFEAEFSSDFQGDLEAVKLSKFHTSGPPNWIWYAPPPGLKALSRLRLNRPASGLTINEDALAIYQPMAVQEEKNAEIKKQLADIKKKRKKEEKEIAKSDWLPPGKEYITAEDLLPSPPFIPNYPVSKIEPIGICQVCQGPTYGWPDLEYICLWCEKQRDENNQK